MSNDKMGGPAFPDPARAHPHGHPDNANGDGMTLWDYYAAAALQGLLAAEEPDSGLTEASFAEQSADFADAMLKERAKRMEANDA